MVRCIRMQWFVLLILILSWACAISLTFAGIYILFAHSQAQEVHMYINGQVKKVMVQRDVQQSWWTVMDGVLMLIGSCIFNGILLTSMLVCLVRERRRRRLEHRQSVANQQEPPPDYSTVMKEETPPPTYSSLDLDSTTTSTSPSPSPSPSLSSRANSLSPLSETVQETTE
ncbi:hypothetical protein O3P69_018128 [Scylla paramamosain]|uniref:Uncharacterized protein n=2 Tax=Scylla paramamosain TaxID=85552 RepID=A0AAW0TJP3_SCYPA